jgi:hypothetical protein
MWRIGPVDPVRISNIAYLGAGEGRPELSRIVTNSDKPP